MSLAKERSMLFASGMNPLPSDYERCDYVKSTSSLRVTITEYVIKDTINIIGTAILIIVKIILTILNTDNTSPLSHNSNKYILFTITIIT